MYVSKSAYKKYIRKVIKSNLRSNNNEFQYTAIKMIVTHKLIKGAHTL